MRASTSQQPALLPKDVILCIILQIYPLKAATLLNLMLVSKNFCNIIKDNKVWGHAYTSLIASEPLPEISVNFKHRHQQIKTDLTRLTSPYLILLHTCRYNEDKLLTKLLQHPEYKNVFNQYQPQFVTACIIKNNYNALTVCLTNIKKFSVKDIVKLTAEFYLTDKEAENELYKFTADQLILHYLVCFADIKSWDMICKHDGTFNAELTKNKELRQKMIKAALLFSNLSLADELGKQLCKKELNDLIISFKQDDQYIKSNGNRFLNWEFNYKHLAESIRQIVSSLKANNDVFYNFSENMIKHTLSIHNTINELKTLVAKIQSQIRDIKNNQPNNTLASFAVPLPSSMFYTQAKCFYQYTNQLLKHTGYFDDINIKQLLLDIYKLHIYLYKSIQEYQCAQSNIKETLSKTHSCGLSTSGNITLYSKGTQAPPTQSTHIASASQHSPCGTPPSG